MIPDPLYRVAIRLKGPLGTPLTSGTIFGHLCWALLERDGEAALTQWLDGQDSAPFVVSDGLPAGLLPRPLLAPMPRVKIDDVEAADMAKDQARKQWVQRSDFVALRNAMAEANLIPKLVNAPVVRAKPKHDLSEIRIDGSTDTNARQRTKPKHDLSEIRMAHNRIDRVGGSTPDEGGLFFTDEDWRFAENPDCEIYVRATAGANEIMRLFCHVGQSGYGRDSTWGRGQFEVTGVTVEQELDDHRGNRMMSLSHGIITANMRDSLYKLTTHFGKVGAMMANGGARPWKKPILLARPGMTFGAADEGPFGGLLANVHQDRPEIRHDARHVAIPYTEAVP